MSRNTRGIGRVGAGMAGVALGLLPAAAALALGGNNVAAIAPPPLCATGATEPMTIPLEPRPEVLKDAPYSGVGTTEVVTTLADGNRITRTNTMRYFRDSAGRMRTEYQLAAIGPFVPEEAQSIVTITDPVAGRRYVLHPGMKRADVFKLGANGGPMPGANAIFIGGAFASVNGSTQRVGSEPATFVQSPKLRTRLEGPKPDGYRGGNRTPTMIAPPAFAGGTTDVIEPMRGVVVHSSDPVGVGVGPTFNVMRVDSGTPMPVCKGGAMKSAEPVSIGERRIEGLKVTGSRLEFTLDAGAVGNEQPITVRTDQWFSPDLGVVVSGTNHDPMIGDTTYRLEQINRVEPDSALFVVPADYAKHPVGF